MSSIANQIVAIAATLLGFVAHDVLTESKATPQANPIIETAQNIDFKVTRSIDLNQIAFQPVSAAVEFSVSMPTAPINGVPTRTASMTSISDDTISVTPAGARQNRTANDTRFTPRLVVAAR